MLGDGRTIMQQQLDNVGTAFGDSARIIAVVGFKMDLIMERFPDVLYAYNQDYDQTNTSKSLLKACACRTTAACCGSTVTWCSTPPSSTG